MYHSLIGTSTNCFSISQCLNKTTATLLIVILCSRIFTRSRDFTQRVKYYSIFSGTRVFSAFWLHDKIIRTTRGFYLVSARGWFNASFIYAKGEERKNVGGECWYSRERALSPTSRFFIPSFLPSFRGAIWDHAVYISSGYYMHILLSCIRFSTLHRGSLVLLPSPPLPSPRSLHSPQYPVPMPYYTARMQV